MSKPGNRTPSPAFLRRLRYLAETGRIHPNEAHAHQQQFKDQQHAQDAQAREAAERLRERREP